MPDVQFDPWLFVDRHHNGSLSAMKKGVMGLQPEEAAEVCLCYAELLRDQLRTLTGDTPFPGFTLMESQLIHRLLRDKSFVSWEALHQSLYAESIDPPGGEVLRVYLCKIAKKVGFKVHETSCGFGPRLNHQARAYFEGLSNAL